MAGRRTSLASLAGAKVDDVPGKSDPLLLTLPLTKLVPTRFNPRRNFGTPDDLKSFGLVLKRRQLQPAVVVSRTGYLKLWPDEEEHVGDVPYVIANGERRFRGSLAAGLVTLNVVHNEDVAASRADFLDAVLSENNDREDLDPIERAIGIETMVHELGGADRVAAHYQKTKGWVSQQRKLLKLTPALQTLVSSGEMAVRVGRDIAGLRPDEQAAAWAAEVKRRTEVKSAPRVRKLPEQSPVEARPQNAGPSDEPSGSESAPTAVENVERFTAVNRAPQPASTIDAVNAAESATSPPSPTDQTLPEPRTEPGSKPAIKMPWYDGAAAMNIAYANLTKHEQHHQALTRYIQLAGGPKGFAADLVASSSPEFRAQLIDLLIEAD